MDISNNLIVLYKELFTIIKKIKEFNTNGQLIIDSFVIKIHSEHILKLNREIIKQKGISYVFTNNSLTINFYN